MKRSKPVAPRPVLFAWAMCDENGIVLEELGSSRNYLRWMVGLGWNPPRRVIRVEIRPAPKQAADNAWVGRVMGLVDQIESMTDKYGVGAKMTRMARAALLAILNEKCPAPKRKGVKP